LSFHHTFEFVSSFEFLHPNSFCQCQIESRKIKNMFTVKGGNSSKFDAVFGNLGTTTNSTAASSQPAPAPEDIPVYRNRAPKERYDDSRDALNYDSDAQDLDSGDEDERCRAPDEQIFAKWKRQREEEDEKDNEKWPKGDKLIEQQIPGDERGGRRVRFADDDRRDRRERDGDHESSSSKGRKGKGKGKGKGYRHEGDRRAQPKRRLTDRVGGRAPDHVKNPSKYTHYNLEGVTHSKAQNASAAFDFLNELKARREGTSGTSKPQSTETMAKPTFKKRNPEAVDKKDYTEPAAVRSGQSAGSRVMGEDAVAVGKRQNDKAPAKPKIAAKVNKSKLSMMDSDSDASMD
jgi:hypothetical protein